VCKGEEIVEMRITGAEFIKSTKTFDPQGRVPLREISFIGRSNVGKSSLINSLVMQKIARTSSTPGATKLINLYRVRADCRGQKEEIVFSDFPGFGYAKVAKSTYSGWETMVSGYLTRNRWVAMLVWVYDVRRQIDEMDRLVIQWLESIAIPTTLVITKIDKETQGVVVKKYREMASLFGAGNTFLFSARDGRGRGELTEHLLSPDRPI